MGTKERILTIRLLEKIMKDPAYAEMIGIEVLRKRADADPKGRDGRNT